MEWKSVLKRITRLRDEEDNVWIPWGIDDLRVGGRLPFTSRTVVLASLKNDYNVFEKICQTFLQEYKENLVPKISLVI